MTTECSYAASDRRVNFWATQPDACGSNDLCGYQCGTAGLQLTALGNANDGCSSACDITLGEGCAPVSNAPARFATTDWVRGLVINMMMTDGKRPDTECGYRPNSQGGHWSESYISGGSTSIGSLVRTIEPAGSMNTSIATVVAYAQATLDRLVARGVARSVTVTGTYISAGSMRLDIVVYGTSNNVSRVGLSGTRLANGWAWV